MKKVLWTLPVLALGIAIGSFAMPNVFASNNTPSNTEYRWMQSAMDSPQGQAMFQACGNYMTQYAPSQK